MFNIFQTSFRIHLQFFSPLQIPNRFYSALVKHNFQPKKRPKRPKSPSLPRPCKKVVPSSRIWENPNRNRLGPTPSKIVLHLLIKHGPMTTRQLFVNYCFKYPDHFSSLNFLKKSILNRLWKRDYLKKKPIKGKEELTRVFEVFGVIQRKQPLPETTTGGIVITDRKKENNDGFFGREAMQAINTAKKTSIFLWGINFLHQDMKPEVVQRLRNLQLPEANLKERHKVWGEAVLRKFPPLPDQRIPPGYIRPAEYATTVEQDVKRQETKTESVVIKPHVVKRPETKIESVMIEPNVVKRQEKKRVKVDQDQKVEESIYVDSGSMVGMQKQSMPVGKVEAEEQIPILPDLIEYLETEKTKNQKNR